MESQHVGLFERNLVQERAEISKGNLDDYQVIPRITEAPRETHPVYIVPRG